MKRERGHYDDAYFAWQASVGEFGGWANLPKFSGFVGEGDAVLDFGCGGGYLLARLACRKRVGVEVNPSAADTARANGVEVYPSTDRVPDDYVDVVVSNHALEHTPRPLDELRLLGTKVRRGGTLVFVVPCESISHDWQPDDINRHLYSWSPMALGNLFTEAGFELLRSEPYLHKWPPRYRTIARLGGRPAFDLASRVWARLSRSWFQVRAVARRPA